MRSPPAAPINEPPGENVPSSAPPLKDSSIGCFTVKSSLFLMFFSFRDLGGSVMDNIFRGPRTGYYRASHSFPLPTSSRICIVIPFFFISSSRLSSRFGECRDPPARLVRAAGLLFSASEACRPSAQVQRGRFFLTYKPLFREFPQLLYFPSFIFPLFRYPH